MADVIDQNENMTLIGRTMLSQLTSTNVSSLFTGFATRLANRASFNKLYTYVVLSQDTILTCCVRDDDFNIITQTSINAVTQTGLIEFTFDSDVTANGDNIYISIEASDRVLGIGMVGSSNTSYCTADNMNGFGNYQKTTASWIKVVSQTNAKSISMYIYTVDIKNVYTVKNTQNFNIGSVKFSEISIGNYATSLVIDNKYLYKSIYGAIEKIDFSDEQNPSIASTLQLTANMGTTGLAISSNYMYAVQRDTTPGLTTTVSITGYLHVIDIDTFTIIKSLELDWKASRCIAYKNTLIVNLQMKGFDVYDITTPSNPSLLSKYRVSNREYQGGEMYEKDGILYYVCGAFGYGIYIYSLEDRTLPEEIGGFNFSRIPELKGIVHTYDIILDYPYCYSTIATTNLDDINTPDIRGILQFKIDDVTMLQDNTIDGLSYHIANIYDKDKSNIINDGDTKPTKMCRYGDYLICNSGQKGLAIFSIEDNQLNYCKLIKGNQKGVVMPIISTDDGRLFASDGSSDLNGKTTYLYRLCI